MKQASTQNWKDLFRSLGPGLLFASSAIGTSHLVLSTRAGAHYGMIFFWIILAAMLLKYPFYEFGPRYASATGYSLVKGYREQGRWAVYLFLIVIFINMFAVTGAIGAVSAGLLSTMFGVQVIPVPLLAGLVIGLTVIILLWGGYPGLDRLIKIISVVLLVAVLTAFVAVLSKGPVAESATYTAPPLLEGAGLALLIGLLGWMPAGMEASTMNSIWSVEKMRTSGRSLPLRESLFDFNLGYVFTLALALMFLTIGAYTVFGSGVTLEGNATAFSNQLLGIFTSNLGPWSYFVFAISAFGTIYGTLITVLDAFPRCFVRGLRVLKFTELDNNEEQNGFLERQYRIWLIITGFGGFALFYFSAASMIQLLEVVTIISFLTSPVIAWLNLRAISSTSVSEDFRPSRAMIWLAYAGLLGLLAFSMYYLLSTFG